MHVDSAVVSRTISALGSSISSLNAAVTLAQKSKDIALKHQLSEALDGVLELKQSVHNLAEENRKLQGMMGQKASIKHDPIHGYWYAQGDPEPLCPKCWEGEGKQAHLGPLHPWNYGTRRICPVCQFIVFETKPAPQERRVYSPGIICV